VDHVIRWQRSKWRNLFESYSLVELVRTIINFLSGLRKVKYDLVIDLQGLLRTNVFASLCVSSNKISLGSEFCGKLFVNKVFPRDHKSRRISSEYLDLAKKLDLNYENFSPRFFLPKLNDTSNQIKSILKNKEYFIIIPFTTRPEKHWSNIHWNKLIKLLINSYKIQCIVVGGKVNDKQKRLLEILDQSVVSLVDKTTLVEAATLIKFSNFVIGVDTGLTHISVSLNKPTIALFGETCPYLFANRKKTKVIWTNKECTPCIEGENDMSIFSCLKGIHPNNVFNEIKNILK